MNWLVFHIVSGQVFFSGISLMLVAAVASSRPKPVFKRITILALLIGVLAISISATPIPYWYYALAAIATLIWMASLKAKR